MENSGPSAARAVTIAVNLTADVTLGDTNSALADISCTAIPFDSSNAMPKSQLRCTIPVVPPGDHLLTTSARLNAEPLCMFYAIVFSEWLFK